MEKGNAGTGKRLSAFEAGMLIVPAWFTDIRLKIKGKQFFKVVIYMPNLIMASAFAMLFFALFSEL